MTVTHEEEKGPMEDSNSGFEERAETGCSVCTSVHVIFSLIAPFFLMRNRGRA